MLERTAACAKSLRRSALSSIFLANKEHIRQCEQPASNVIRRWSCRNNGRLCAKMMMMCSGTLQFLLGTLVCGAAGAARGVSFALQRRPHQADSFLNVIQGSVRRKLAFERKISPCQLIMCFLDELL